MTQKKQRKMQRASIIAIIGLLGVFAAFGISKYINTINIYPSAKPCLINSTSNAENTYSCSLFNLKLSKDWRVGNNQLASQQLPQGWAKPNQPIANTEFYNYDLQKASQRDYDSQLDKGMQKFDIFVINTTTSLENLAKENAQNMQYTIVSTKQSQVNGYSILRVNSTYSMGNVTTYYVQDRTNSLVAVITPIFGFNSSLSDFEKMVISAIHFTQ